MTEHPSPYAGSTTPPPGAGQRAEMPQRSSQMLPGGLFAADTRVRVTIPDGTTHTGTMREFGSVPAPHIVLTGDWVSLGPDSTIVICLGPGITIEHAPPKHPAL